MITRRLVAALCPQCEAGGRHHLIDVCAACGSPPARADGRCLCDYPEHRYTLTLRERTAEPDDE
jgi:hypothetical protein